MDYVIVTCPDCQDPIYIEKRDFNCKIFRHGVYKHNNTQIPPHLNKLECDRLAQMNLIYGCGKPFRLQLVNNLPTAVRCEYI